MNSSQLPLHHLSPQALHLHQIPPGLQPLEELSPQANDAFFQHRYAQQLQASNPHALHFQSHGLQQTAQPPFEGFTGGYARFDMNAPPNPPPPAPQHQIQAPPPPPRAQVATHLQGPPQLQELAHRGSFVQTQEQPLVQEQVPDNDEAPIQNHGQIEGLRLIPNPPNLETWREKLFHVDDTITLTEEEYVRFFSHQRTHY